MNREPFQSVEEIPTALASPFERETEQTAQQFQSHCLLPYREEAENVVMNLVQEAFLN